MQAMATMATALEVSVRGVGLIVRAQATETIQSIVQRAQTLSRDVQARRETPRLRQCAPLWRVRLRLRRARRAAHRLGAASHAAARWVRPWLSQPLAPAAPTTSQVLSAGDTLTAVQLVRAPGESGVYLDPQFTASEVAAMLSSPSSRLVAVVRARALHCPKTLACPCHYIRRMRGGALRRAARADASRDRPRAADGQR
jgi:hypothetical protein